MSKDMNNIDDTFNIVAGKIIKKYREKNNMSLEDVVGKMKNPVTRQSLYKYENNKARMKNNVYIDICNAIGIDPNDTYQEINDTALYVNLNHSEYDNKEIMNKIKPEYNDELEQLISNNKNILTESDKAIIKTIIEERRKEIENENT